jgi:hypothetical protein
MSETTESDIRGLMVAIATLTTQLQHNEKATNELRVQMTSAHQDHSDRLVSLEKWQAKLLGAFALIVLIAQFL